MLSVRKYSGARSMRDYARSLGTDPTLGRGLSVTGLVSADILHRNWRARGADVEVGPPVADVVRTNGRFSRQYSGARLSVAALSEQVQEDEAYEALVYIAGIECIRRGKDQAGGPNNEVYMVVTPIDGSNVVVDVKNNKFTVNAIETDTTGGVNGGDFFGIGLPIWRGRNPASLTFSIALWEEDEGNKVQAKAAVEKQVRSVAKTVAMIGGLATGNPAFLAGQLPKVDELAKSLSAPIRDLLDLADDHIGSGVKHLSYDDLRGNPPPVKEPDPDGVVTAKTRGEPIAIGQGADTGEFKIHFFWETRPLTHFE